MLCARAAYSHYCQLMESAQWRALQSAGARPHRLLWASTGTKDPTYSDVKYVESLVYPDTVTTLPPATLAAYRNHGRPARQVADSKSADVAIRDLARLLADVEIDLHAVAARLQADGIQKFVDPHEAILASLRTQIASIAA